MLKLSSPETIKAEDQFEYGTNNISEIIKDLENINHIVSVERPIHQIDRDIVRRTCDKLRYLRSIMEDLEMHSERGAYIEYDFRSYVFRITELLGNTEGKIQNISIFNCCEALGVIVDCIDYYHSSSHPQRIGFFARLLTGRK